MFVSFVFVSFGLNESQKCIKNSFSGIWKPSNSSDNHCNNFLSFFSFISLILLIKLMSLREGYNWYNYLIWHRKYVWNFFFIFFCFVKYVIRLFHIWNVLLVSYLALMISQQFFSHFVWLLTHLIKLTYLISINYMIA